MDGSLRARREMLFRAPAMMVFDAIESPARWAEWDPSVRGVEAPFRLAAEGGPGTVVVAMSGGRWTGRIVTWAPGREVAIEIVSGRYLGCHSGQIRHSYANEPLGCRVTFELRLPEPASSLAKLYAAWFLRRIERHFAKCLTRLRYVIECVPPD